MDLYASLKDKVVLITGASGGIGGAVSKLMNEAGSNVYATDISKGNQHNFFQGDITDQSFINQMVDEIRSKEGRIDVLVNSAGIYLRRNGEPAKYGFKQAFHCSLRTQVRWRTVVIGLCIAQRSA